MSLDFTTLDVFTTKKYFGNPLAIVRVPAGTVLSQSQKQLIAREFNLSETVFLHDQNESDIENSSVRIDIFTTTAEVPFAGHPTVGTSNYLLHYLTEDDKIKSIKALQTKAGRIPIARNGTGIELHVAHNVHIHENHQLPSNDVEINIVSIVKGMTFVLAQCKYLHNLGNRRESLIGANKTYTSAELLDEGWREGIVCTYYYAVVGGADELVIRTRMFGSREDPATGSAASALCCFWSLRSKIPKQKYHIMQGIEMGRRSDIFIQVTLKENGTEVEDVLLSGDAVKVMEGRVDVPDNSA